MTPRPHARTRRAAAISLLAFAGLISLAGCDPRTLFYFLQPYEPTIEPPKDAPDLKGKKIVVVATTAAGSQSEFMSLDRDLVREFIHAIRAKVSKVEIVNPDSVWDWVEGNPTWTNPGEIAEKFEADLAIYLEVDQFQMQAPGDLNVLHGVARIHIKALERAYPKNSKGKSLTDQPKESREVYEDYVDIEFPKKGPIPSDSITSRGKFKTTFLKVVAAECSWHFVEHAPEDEVEQERMSTR